MKAVNTEGLVGFGKTLTIGTRGGRNGKVEIEANAFTNALISAGVPTQYAQMRVGMKRRATTAVQRSLNKGERFVVAYNDVRRTVYVISRADGTKISNVEATLANGVVLDKITGNLQFAGSYASSEIEAAFKRFAYYLTSSQARYILEKYFERALLGFRLGNNGGTMFIPQDAKGSREETFEHLQKIKAVVDGLGYGSNATIIEIAPTQNNIETVAQSARSEIDKRITDAMDDATILLEQVQAQVATGDKTGHAERSLESLISRLGMISLLTDAHEQVLAEEIAYVKMNHAKVASEVLKIRAMLGSSAGVGEKKKSDDEDDDIDAGF